MATTQAIGLIKSDTISNLDADTDQLIKFPEKIVFGQKVSIIVENVKWATTQPTIQLVFSHDSAAAFGGSVAAKNVSGLTTETVNDVVTQDKSDGVFAALNYIANGGDATVKFKATLLVEKPIS